ncbi:MAG: hypothetical protein PHE87_04490, partial [Victivallaceae bacterium]|nr:hypothetical protein [Victivallaceae bacterium]
MIRASWYKLIMLSVFLLIQSVYSGSVETGRDGKTIINIKVNGLPDATSNDAYTRSEVAAVKEFIKVFPQTFATKYRDKYKANPEKYGNYNWDNVEIRLHPFSGI